MLGGCCTINTTDERDMVTQTKGVGVVMRKGQILEGF